MEPPYVYNVFKDDKEGFIDAVKQALANPIHRHILPRMTMPAIQKRLAAILETDLRKEAEAVLVERKRSGGQVCRIDFHIQFCFSIRFFSFVDCLLLTDWFISFRLRRRSPCK